MEGGGGGACDGASSWTVRVPCASPWFWTLPFSLCVCVQLQLLLRCRRSPAAFLSIANQEVECTVWIQSCEVYSSPHGDPVGKKDACVWLMYRALMVNDRNHLTGIRLNVSFNFVCLSYLVSLWCHYCFNPWCTGTLLILYLQSGSRRVFNFSQQCLNF